MVEDVVKILEVLIDDHEDLSLFDVVVDEVEVEDVAD
jgi:hypothetical protein